MSRSPRAIRSAVATNPDAEQARRAGLSLNTIAAKEAKSKLPLSAPRLLAVRKPAGATEVLLAYLPFTDDRAMTAEIVKALTGLVRAAGTVDVALIEALSDPLSARQ